MIKESITLKSKTASNRLVMCFFTREGHPEAGYFSDMSEAVKKAVSVPVITTGGVSSPEEAELLLKEGKADLIGIGRKMNRFFESYNRIL